jgi:hypothetical protein
MVLLSRNVLQDENEHSFKIKQRLDARRLVVVNRQHWVLRATHFTILMSRNIHLTDMRWQRVNSPLFGEIARPLPTHACNPSHFHSTSPPGKPHLHDYVLQVEQKVGKRDRSLVYS